MLITTLIRINYWAKAWAETEIGIVSNRSITIAIRIDIRDGAKQGVKVSSGHASRA